MLTTFSPHRTMYHRFISTLVFTGINLILIVCLFRVDEETIETRNKSLTIWHIRRITVFQENRIIFKVIIGTEFDTGSHIETLVSFGGMFFTGLIMNNNSIIPHIIMRIILPTYLLSHRR